MTMWLIEKFIFSDEKINNLKNVLRENQISFLEVEFTINQPLRMPVSEHTFVIAYGSMEFIQYCESKFPGIWRNDNFNEQNVLANIQEHYVNHNSIVVNFQEIENYAEQVKITPFFIKPNKDNKEFAGRVFNSIEEFVLWKNNLLSIGYIQNIDFDVIFAKAKTISGEFRIVVVNKSIVSVCSYGKQHRLDKDQAIDFAKTMIDIFNPSDIYVMDVGMVDNSWKVIEYNVFNSADMYDGNINNIVVSIEQFVNK